MILSLKIKEECLLGFIHSRITGLAGRVEAGISIISKENINKLSVFETELRSVLDKNTLENINKKIETAPIIIANMYHDNYTKLLDCLEKEVKEGDSYIESLIGLGLLMCHLERDARNEDRIGIKQSTLKAILDEFEVNNTCGIKYIYNMLRASYGIYDNYYVRASNANKKTKKK